MIAGVIYANVAAKQIYVRLFRGTRHMHESTWLSVGTWVGIVLALWIVGWIIAESIPVFNGKHRGQHVYWNIQVSWLTSCRSELLDRRSLRLVVHIWFAW